MSELDDALLCFAQTGLEYAGGLSNHGPMVAEALQALGHASLIPAWVDVYAARLRPREQGEPIAPGDWSGALGSGRDGDWIATFEAELARSDPADVLARWLARLVPGLFAAATHGPIRTAHAVRALEQHDAPERRRELAIGLAYWASRYQVLPGSPGGQPERGLGPASLLRSLPLLDPAARRPGFFTEAVGALSGDPAFASAIDRFDAAALPYTDALSELCATAAGLYLAHPEARIAYAHCVTAPSALRMLDHHLDEGALRVSLGYAVQAVAALHATHGRVTADLDGPPHDADLARLAESPAELRYRAACSMEEHAVKLTEACLREDAIRPDPRLRLAAADAATRIGSSHGGRGG
jgi:hypothetical protein